MRIVFTGGGTGGHVFPNLAVIDELKALNGSIEIFYLGGKNSFEEKIVEAALIPFYGIHTGKLRRYFDMRNFIDAFKFPLGVIEAIWILRKIKPQLVFAKGGYVSMPVVLAARFLKIPVWLHESDVTPGLGTKLCSRFASKIFLSFEESRSTLTPHPSTLTPHPSTLTPHPSTLVLGNPVRKKILHGSKEKGYKLTGFSEKLPIILVVGGSSGAVGLNKLIEQILPDLLKEAQIIHITGSYPASHSPRLTAHTLARTLARTSLPRHTTAPNLTPFSAPNYRAFEFLGEELAHIYAISDLVITRAGSGGIFETLAWQKPMILVPLPRSASRGDQIENAHACESRGWALTIDQNTTSPKEFLEKIRLLLHDEKLRASMIENQKKAAPYCNAAQKIAQAMMNFKHF